MLKSISIQSNNTNLKTSYITLIAKIHNISSNSELNTLIYLTNNANNLKITITPQYQNQILKEIMLIESTFNQSVNRLKKSGLLTKNGKTITLHPVLGGLDDINGLIIRFFDKKPILQTSDNEG